MFLSLFEIPFDFAIIMQFANKHFDFSARYIELPPIPSHNIIDQRRGLIRHDPPSTSEEWHLWAAAQTLLSLHHQYHGSAAYHEFNSDSSMISFSSSRSPTSSGDSSNTGRQNSDTASSTEEEDEEDNDHDTPETAAKTRTTTTTAITQGVAKPRWSDEERSKLVQAVIHEKALDKPASFHWPRIAHAVSPHHSSQACQDRWVKGMLPVLATMYSSSADDTLFLGQVHAVSDC
jgi:hypothetical protein